MGIVMAENFLTALVADHKGDIFELKGYAAVGMAGPSLEKLTPANTRKMPFGSELMFLPDRRPVVYNLDAQQLETLLENPYAPGEPLYPVAAFNSPGFVISHSSAYQEMDTVSPLPLFSYGAVGWQADGFRTAVIQVDREPRQDLRYMKQNDVEKGVQRMRKRLPRNRLRKHLENCALAYGCPAGKNFFLKRYEAPLPASQSCNARCMGCISKQSPDSQIPVCQNRIGFTPTATEIAAVALEHIRHVPKAVVSFGQGCEGDPLLAASVIIPAIALIRSRTDKGTINLNTNGSRPNTLARMWRAGLDSIRISLNSVRERCYAAYYRPQGYEIADVFKSIEQALERGKFVSINYLNFPGFTDSPEESDAFQHFLQKYPIQMVQWRNLNIDPTLYWQTMKAASHLSPPLGMKRIINAAKSKFPKLQHGYFNPPKERFKLR
jgi:pyruvate-formate lyase-activating enzyme